MASPIQSSIAVAIFASDKGPGDPERASLMGEVGRVFARKGARMLCLAENGIIPVPLITAARTAGGAVEIVADAIQQLSGRPAVRTDAILSTRDLTRARQIREFAESTLDKPVTLTDIAREVGVSTSSLQRLFKQAYGVTVIEFIRSQRLLKARDALERDGITVAQAAYLAGFSSPANFATAFKRAFGTSPSQLKD